MGPKKSAGKKGAAPENGGEMDADAKAKMYMLTCQSLQVQLAERTEDASKAMAEKRELKVRVAQIQKDFEEEQEQTFEMRQDMTRQYKGMQEELLSRINKLEETIQDLNDMLAEADVKHEKVLKEKNAIIQLKDEEISELKSKMDDMSEEFGEMLRETLEKMRERIEISSGNFDGPDMPIQQRMEELKHQD
mmetsp:Transcript_27093/g.45756  ORF Transcript_27093/g.45756 Transcript_27093/m.45756 type:complete len:191 (+) Transcript_27093:36-608(+)|eukprot:CAMPEP_0114430830 /NCGR_PEP_ID=MMETSP0103-20121206/10254_1 /TAXON_ID=37642 ORGANISM="Paraphysomonas imperforata, Strain PA2" /NCGR_SAMPLE_ID=MMETSP0103 /ASSEMBLY_ACC=CAM_ASM_000201 /LENGTH=190 /DNA_ID=CAMNT_0001600311 /DNA_START=31 /DNA_END=603 /DNA_ORIENTATION=-